MMHSARRKSLPAVVNSSCLDRLNNFGIIGSQKLQNLPQNVIIKIVGTLFIQKQNSRDINVQIGLIRMINTQKALKTYNK